MQFALFVFAAVLASSGDPASTVPATPAPEPAKLSPELAAVVEAELGFSRTSGERGVREAFLAYFADDAVSFEPDPGPAIERIRAWPDPQRPRQLSWHPVFADISRAGDMGYTTGPTLSQDLGPDPQPDRHGYYFSVWRKQADGQWKVAIDVGISTPGLEAPEPGLRAASAPGYASGKPADVAAARAAIFALEREVDVDTRRLAQESRLHRDGSFPLVGREAVLADLERRVAPTRCEPADVVVSASADLAFSYGAFIRGESRDAPAAERGFYTHVWKRAPTGDWEIVARIETI